jgi:hypothetical protein
MADDTIEIKITANASDLQAALQQAAQAVQGASAAMGASAATAGNQATKTVKQQAREQAKAWESAFKPVESGFDSMLMGMITKHQSFNQALAKGTATFVNAEISADVKRLGHWLSSQAAQLAGFETTKTAQVATAQTANAATAASDAATTKSSIVQHAASAAAAVYDDVAQIPYVGWILAPPAAVAAFAGVMAFGSSVPGLAVGAWNLPNDMVAQLHAGETVMPADFASGFRSAVAGGGTGDSAGGGDNYHITIQAIDTQSGAQFLKDNAKTIVTALQGQARNFNPALRSS